MNDDQTTRSASTDTQVSSGASHATTETAANSISPSALTTGATVLVIAFLLRSGITNIILVPLCAAVLLLNPWVRLFLGLVSVNEEKAKDNTTSFDPIHLIRYLAGGGDDKGVSDEANGSSGGPQKSKADQKIHLDKSAAYAALRRMPASLRRPLSDLEELLIRDCICSWYNYHSFGDPSLPNEARFSIDYGIGSLFNALEEVRSADVMAELLLAAASVLLVTLRYRRIHPKRAPIFANDSQRVQALREALDRVFARHLRKDDAQCDLMRTLLREIICKQFWNALGGIGEPDFINQQIIQWHERDQNAFALDDSVMGGIREGMQPMSRMETPQPVTPQAAAHLSQRPSPHSSALASPERGTSPVHLRRNGDIRTPLHDQTARSLEEFNAASSNVAPSPIPTDTNSVSEPRTTQPRAMAMPSPLARSSYSMSSAPTPPSLLASTPVMEHHQSPSMTRDGRTTRVAPVLSANDTAASLNSPGPSRISKPVFSAAAPAEIGDEAMSAWDEAIPMNVPPTAHQGMQLPDSLRKSMRNGQEDVSQAEEKQTSEIDNEGYRIAEDAMVASKDSTFSSRLSAGERSSIDSRTSRPRSPAARSSNNSSDVNLAARPPSRVPSAASGGIPPAPDMAEVLSNKTVSAGYTALRDAFESFLERGGVANRSLFFSPPSAATVAPGEGMTLLRLHVGLNAIARLVPAPTSEALGSASDENEDHMYRDDALGILQKGLESLVETDEGGIAGRALREALAIAVQRLDSDGQARIRDVTAPVERALWTRLHGLYEHFWKETCTRPAGTRQPTLGSNPTSGSNTPARESFSLEPSSSNASANWARNSREFRQQRSDFEARSNITPTTTDTGELPYEPRRKPGKSPAIKSTPLPDEENGGASTSSPASTLQALPEGFPVVQQGDSTEIVTPSRPPLHSFGPTITVTDVSVNAERPKAPADLRTYEVMIAVEGLASESGGFVLVRHWKDFQQLDEELKRATTLPKTNVQMPNGRGMSSEELTAELQRFLQHLLVSPLHTTSHAVQYFVDKGRAGEETSADRMNVLLDSLQLGKGLDFGKNLASGMVNTLQKGTRAAVNRAGSFPAPVSLGGGNSVETESRSLDSPSVRPGMQARQSSEENDAIGPQQLAHLPIGIRKTQGRMPGGVVGGGGGSAPLQHGLGIEESTNGSASANVVPQSVGGPNLPTASASKIPKGPSSSSSSTISSDDLDNFLSCTFAIADEAFSLSGGWTFRRGMLRVFEQIVRTQYWSSISAVFDDAAQMVTPEQLGKWCSEIQVKFWPDEPSGGNAVNDGHDTKEPTPVEALGEAVVDAAIEASQANGGHHTSTPTVAAPPPPPTTTTDVKRTPAQRLETHRKAQAILLSYIPASSAIFMGPGGRQSCQRALICVHEEICQPSTSLDLVLTVVLKMCDIAAR